MNLTKRISYPIRRLKVDYSILTDLQKDFRSTLDIRGKRGSSGSARSSSFEETYHRAGRDEDDGILRHGPMGDRLDQIVHARRGSFLMLGEICFLLR